MCAVLTVDDDPHIRKLMTIMLEKLGCQPIDAQSGIEAEMLTVIMQPALVLLDIMMPLQDGFETCWKMRAHGYTGRIIFVTAQPVEPSMIEACGADGYLRKPITLQTLACEVGAVV